MRLIDADKIDFSKAFGGQSEFAKDLIAAAQKLIDMQPTAFDKEKVMNEIKEYKEDSEEWAKKPIENADEFSTYADAYKRCLAIVEKGGLDE